MPNQSPFLSPLTPSYWKEAFAQFKSLRTLALAALFVALRVVVSSMFIPVGENLRIYASFFVTALGAILYGPVVAVATGFAADLLEVFLFPSGAFFIGYTISAMAGSLLYALALYRRPIGFVRVALAKLSVNLLVNIGLGSLWSAILYSKGFYYYLAKSIVKNLLLFPVEAVLLFLFLKAILPAAAKGGFLPPAQASVFFLKKEREKHEL